MPKDKMSRRTFMKGLGALATLPLVGKYFKLVGAGSKAAEGIQTIKNTATAMPEWFGAFVSKMKRNIPERVDADLYEYSDEALPGVKMYERADGEIFVEGKNYYDQPYEIKYEPPKTLEDGTRFRGEFDANEGRPRMTDPDGGYEVEMEYLDDLDDMMGGSRELQEFATGKKIGKELQGEYNISRAESMADAARKGEDYASGGYVNTDLTKTIPPARGPMSEGVASLFERR